MNKKELANDLGNDFDGDVGSLEPSILSNLEHKYGDTNVYSDFSYADDTSVPPILFQQIEMDLAAGLKFDHGASSVTANNNAGEALLNFVFPLIQDILMTGVGSTNTPVTVYELALYFADVEILQADCNTLALLWNMYYQMDWSQINQDGTKRVPPTLRDLCAILRVNTSNWEDSWLPMLDELQRVHNMQAFEEICWPIYSSYIPNPGSRTVVIPSANMTNLISGAVDWDDYFLYVRNGLDAFLKHGGTHYETHQLLGRYYPMVCTYPQATHLGYSTAAHTRFQNMAKARNEYAESSASISLNTMALNYPVAVTSAFVKTDGTKDTQGADEFVNYDTFDRGIDVLEMATIPAILVRSGADATMSYKQLSMCSGSHIYLPENAVVGAIKLGLIPLNGTSPSADDSKIMEYRHLFASRFDIRVDATLNSGSPYNGSRSPGFTLSNVHYKVIEQAIRNLGRDLGGELWLAQLLRAMGGNKARITRPSTYSRANRA